MGKVKEMFEEEIERVFQKSEINFNTGSTLLDVMIGGGIGMGSPAGRIINLVGESSSGKTFFAAEMIAAALKQHKDKFKFKYDDVERTMSLDSEKLWGYTITTKDEKMSETIEELYYNIRKFLRDIKSDECGIYVVDSLDALMSDEQEEIAEARMKAGDKGQTYGKGSYGMSLQKFLSQEFFRKIIVELKEKNALLIFLSQLRDNVNAGLYGKKRRKSGGSALQFYLDEELSLRSVERFEKNGLIYGLCVEAELTKSKTPRPYRKCLVNLLFSYGIDDISSNIDFIYDLKTDTGKLKDNTMCNIGDTSDERYGKYELTLDGVKEMLQAESLYDTAVDDLKDAGIKRTKDGYLNWLNERHEDLFKAYFGEPISREDLIALADADKNVRNKLKQDCINKWEEREKSVLTNRRSKYDEE